MANLLKFQAKKCWTASGILIQDDKTLLIKHKKLGLWLCPGGHVDPEEAPHETAEREFLEEAGVKVQAVDYLFQADDDATEFVPSPIESNIHWVCRENYEKRIKSDHPEQRVSNKTWPCGCEQHINFVYLVEPFNKKQELILKRNEQETTDIGWFGLDELPKLTEGSVTTGFLTQFRHGLDIRAGVKQN